MPGFGRERQSLSAQMPRRLRRTPDDENTRSAVSATAKLPPFYGLDLSSRYAGGSWYYCIPRRSLPQPHQGAFGTVIFMTAAEKSSIQQLFAGPANLDGLENVPGPSPANGNSRLPVYHTHEILAGFHMKPPAHGVEPGIRLSCSRQIVCKREERNLAGAGPNRVRRKTLLTSGDERMRR